MSQAHTFFARHTPAVKEVHIVWLTAGLGCDGDSVSITAATQPSLEDLVLVRFPVCPKYTCTIPCWPTKWATTS